jgi:hypothetical protein
MGDMLVKPTVLLVVTLDYRRCPTPGVRPCADPCLGQ